MEGYEHLEIGIGNWHAYGHIMVRVSPPAHTCLSQALNMQMPHTAMLQAVRVPVPGWGGRGLWGPGRARIFIFARVQRLHQVHGSRRQARLPDCDGARMICESVYFSAYFQRVSCPLRRVDGSGAGMTAAVVVHRHIASPFAPDRPVEDMSQ